MPTLLVTKKMPPALVARVRASVSGVPTSAGKRPLFGKRARTVFLRIAVTATAVALVAAVVSTRIRRRRELERARTELLDEVRAKAASRPADAAGFIDRVDARLEELAAPFQGDVVDASLRAPGALVALFQRPSVFVRGPVGAFTRRASTADATSTSFKDALLLCLVDPPTARDEKTILARVFDAYRGGAEIERETPHARLLEEVQVGIPFVLPPWEARVRSAETVADIEQLSRDFHKAPTERAVEGTRASVLIAAMDEPGVAGGPVELDGERPHDIRLSGARCCVRSGLPRAERSRRAHRARRGAGRRRVRTCAEPRRGARRD